MPRLLWIHTNFVTGDQPGNARGAHHVAAWLHRGWQVDVVCTSKSYWGDHLGGKVSDQVTVETEGGLTVHRLPPPVARDKSGEYLRFCLAALSYARSLPRPDAVFASSPVLPQLLPSLLLACAWRRPYILEIRDLWPAFLEQGGQLRNPIVLAAMEWLEALSYRAADACATVAPAYVPYMVGMGADERFVLVAPTGSDPRVAKLCTEERARCRAELGLSEQDRLVLYAGSFSWAYAIDTLLDSAQDAVEREPNIVWAFAGNGTGRERVEEVARSHPRIRYLGSLVRDEFITTLAAADVGLVGHSDFPLFGITISGKVFDYLAAGLPVVCLQAGQTGAIVRAAGGGVVLSAGDAASLTDAVVDLVRKPDAVRRKIGQQGRHWALTHSHAEVMAERVVDLVEAAVARGKHATPARFVRAAAGGAWDVLRQRGARLLSEHYSGRLEATVDDAFARWLQDEEGLALDDSRRTAALHLLPRLLSPRFGTPLTPDSSG